MKDSKRIITKSLIAGIFLISVTLNTIGQALPELLYYKFDATGTTVQNFATSPVGNNPASITGTGLTIGGTGLSGYALQGTGASTTSGVINTGWNTNLSGSFTIAFWTSSVPSSATLYYIFGDAGAASFRCFTNGVAGANNWMIRGGGLPDLLISGAATMSPNMIHAVYDAPTNTFKSYVNGVLNTTVSVTGSISMAGSGFQVGGYASNSDLYGLMDEFRIYNRALTQTEITATYNITLGGNKVYNDAGISKIDSPSVLIYPGIYNVRATLKNFGYDTLNSVEFGWSVNGVVQTPPSNWYGALLKDSTVKNLLIGSYNFPNGSNKIKVWTKNPNSISDSNRINDTMTYNVIACTPFSGTYTIDQTGNGNFLSIIDAVSAISSCGLVGPTKFIIKPGNYVGRVVIPSFSGLNATNTLTFEGVSPDSVNVVFSTTSSTANAVIALNGADYTTIKNLTIINSNESYACGIHLSNQADYNTIENCRILLSTNVSTSTVNPIVASSAEGSPATTANAANYCTFKDNTLVGGYYSIKLYGLASGTPCLGNKLINNTLKQFYYYGAYLYYQKNLLAEYNKIILPRYGYAYSMYVYYNYNSVINANYMNPGAYGIYVSYNQNTGTDSTLITNNVITNFQNGTYQIGIYNYYSYRIYMFNNNVWCDGNYTSPISYGCISNYYSQNSVTKNNILKATGNLNCMVVTSAVNNEGDMDYNDYVISSTAFVMSNGSTTYKNLSLWKAAIVNQNYNSMEVEPNWVSKNDLHLQPQSPTMFGQYLGLQKDFDGDKRCILSTTLGADEYPYTPLAPKASFVSYDSTCQNSPIFCRNSASVNDVKVHEWNVNGVEVSHSLNYYHVPTSIGVDTISLITSNCFGTDTFTKYISIGNIIKGPESEFVANKNKAVIGETITLSDISIDCPTSWEWQISPDSIFDYPTGTKQKSYVFVNGTNQFSQNPQIQFRYSDSFDISLKTRNSLDSSVKYKTKYISIVASFNICFDNETEEPEGFIYDNGGSSLSYTSNRKCSFLIHPCASNLSLFFSKMDIRQGDYLRIYDGHDNKGTPLWNTAIEVKGFGDNDSMNFPTAFDTFVSQSGEFFIEFESDGSIEGRGFEAYWMSESGVFSPPIASFEIADTVCNGSFINFENTSTGFNNKYYWDLDGNNINDLVFTTNASWKYNTDGLYKARLMVVNCGGIDTFIKPITVYTSVNKPVTSIHTNNNRPAILTESVNVFALVDQNCVDSVSWEISPSSYTISNGNLHTMSFNFVAKDTVFYDFTLISSYKGMTDTLIVPSFIRGIHYCLPNFSNLSKDLSIAQVSIANITNSSSTGMYPFEDFTSTDDSKIIQMQREVPYTYSVSRYSNYNWAQLKIWIDFNVDGIFDNSTELVAYNLLSRSIDWSGSISLLPNTQVGKTRMRVGIAAVGQEFDACSILNIGEYEDYSVNITPVITPPVITLNGLATTTLNQCDIYNEPGADATDVLGNNISSSILITGTVNPFVSGDYFIHYNVIDQWGNEATEVIRKVTVIQDNIPPTINLLGKSIDTIVVFNTYADPMVVAYDNCSGMDTITVESFLDNTTLGSYIIRYHAFDNNGFSSSIDRTINVIDNVPPTITVFDPDTILLDVNTSLIPRVLQIVDNYYTDFTTVTTGTFYDNFNTGLANAIGVYSLIYTVYDGSGNYSSKTFYVKVLDKTTPDIILRGSRIITLCRFDTIAEPGWDATDDLDPNPVVVTSGSYYTDYLVNFANGWYEMKYTVTDFSGNSNSTFRIVAVSDSLDCASAVNEVKKPEIKVFPNPTTGICHVALNNISGDVHTTLFDVLGNMIVNENIAAENNSFIYDIDLSSLPEGIYYLKLNNEGKSYFTRIVRN